MLLQSRLLRDTVQLAPNNQVLFLNSAADPFVALAAQQISTGRITLAEDNIASLHTAIEAVGLTSLPSNTVRHIAFHEYTLLEPASTVDVAVMNLLYQPNNTWMFYGLQVAAYALKAGGSLYIVGAKDRGVLSIAKRMQEYFGNVETLAISKGQRVVRSRVGTQFIAPPEAGKGKNSSTPILGRDKSGPYDSLVFADGQLDEGTRLLLDVLEVQAADEALDIGCGAGFIGLHIARLASKGHVTMVDASLAAVAVAQQRVEESGLTNIQVWPSDGARAVLHCGFDLVVTNPPFHLGGIQTTETAGRFIREAAQVLRPRGRFYLVANRFLKYEPALRASFKVVEEVGGNTRFKVLRALC
jgi:16S rRNA (guanine1207-N2)-methyltransferase